MGYRYMESYVDASLIYWAICFLLEKLFVLFEKKLDRYKQIAPTTA